MYGSQEVLDMASWLTIPADMDWHRPVPDGCYEYLKYLWNRYKTPIYMTENVGSVSCQDLVLTLRPGYPRQGREPKVASGCVS